MFRPFNPADYPVGAAIFVSYSVGWATHDVDRYIVKRITPAGQIVATRKRGEDEIEIRVNKRGNIVGDGSYGRRNIVGEEEAREIRKEARLRRAWRIASQCAEKVEEAARLRDDTGFAEAFEKLIEARDALAAAQGIEARHDPEEGRGPKDESPVAESDAPKSSQSPTQGGRDDRL